ncbi:MAG: TraB/VirB10 family protein [Rickettsiaceae bacterium]|nr:TraB/VirB10 family protein [Rickettsiaceae bacterium]
MKRFFNSSDGDSNSKKQKYKQYLKMASFIIAMGLVTYGFDYLTSLGNQPKIVKQKEEDEKIKIELGTFAIKGDRLWQHDFDERLIKEKQDRDLQYGKLTGVIEELEEKLRKEKEKSLSKGQEEILELKEQLSWLKQEMQNINAPLRDDLPSEAVITSTKIAEQEELEKPKDMNNYIPAGSFISGILRGGVSASTGTSAPSEPTPIFIMVTGYGDLPKSFKADLTTCRLIGSSFGNLANERIIARVETMSCSDLHSGLVTETDIAGVVHSLDSKNGIKGSVVSMSDKHLKNAMIGGLMSGFAQTGKQGESFLFNGGLGAISQKKPGLKEKLSENSLAGLGNAAEKIADYHLKMAEATAPVIEVPGGARVSVFFSKGVFLGSKNVKEEIKKERK